MSNNPLRIEDRIKKVDDGAGGIIDETVKFPVWFEPTSKGGTPMCAALKQASELMKQWAVDHPTSFPPVIINITDGESSDGDPVLAAKELQMVETGDGPCIVLNIHLSDKQAPPLELPSSDVALADDFAKQLFNMSSMLTPFMVARAKELGMAVEDSSRGFVFNAQAVQVIQFLDIGTRPANLR